MSSIADYLCAPAWAIEATALDGITQSAAAAKGQTRYGHEGAPPKASGYQNVDGVGVVPISGVIMRRADQVNGFYQPRGTSLEQLHNDLAAAAADTSARSVLLAIDSPGGSVDGIIDAAAAIRAMRTTKPVHAHVNGMAASAGYWLAAQASKVTATAGSQVGSIGVYAPLVDNHRLLESFGLDIKYVSSVPGKVDQNLAGKPLDLATMRKAEGAVKDWHAKFIADVAAGRGVSEERAAEWGDASMHFAVDAQFMGLIDGIASQADAIQALRSGAQRARISAETKNETQLMNAQNEGAPQAVAPPVPTSAQDLRGAYPEAVQSIERDAVSAERSRVATIASACKDQPHEVVQAGLVAIADGTSAAEALAAMLRAMPKATAPATSASSTDNRLPTIDQVRLATASNAPLGSAPIAAAQPKATRKQVEDEWASMGEQQRAEFYGSFTAYGIARGVIDAGTRKAKGVS